jgi:2,5-diketo-D-gluconate reductase A
LNPNFRSPMVKLSDGNSIPIVGLGVYKVDNATTGPLVTQALQIGYRLIDTASMYQNEEGVGEGIANSGVPREEVIVSTKFWMDDLGYDQTLRACDKSLGLLGLSYLDIYLIHWPAPKRGLLYVESWKAMERLKNEGLVKSIGVCNFHPHHIDEVLKMAEYPPVMNQIEVHPFLTQDQVIAYNTQHSILTQAWSPLARGQALDNPLISKIAVEHGKSNSQIVLRWHIQRGTAVIPKSTSRDRIIENLNVFDFELSEAQMLEISSLNRNYRTGVDPEDRN